MTDCQSLVHHDDECVGPLSTARHRHGSAEPRAGQGQGGPFHRRGIPTRYTVVPLQPSISLRSTRANSNTLTVQVGNEEARSFYLSQGFTQVRLIKDYYKKIDPPDCYMLSKPFLRNEQT